MKTVNKAYVVIAVGALGALYGWAQEPRPSRMTIPFSDPARPKALQVRIIQGTIHVQGYEGNDVLVEGLSEAGRKNPPPPQIDGLPRVDWGGTDLGAVESNNVVTVAERGAPRPTQLSIQVPVAAAVKLHAVNAEEVTVDRVSGDVEVNLTHGAVTATHISGSAAVHVVDGKIKVVLDRVAGDKPVSLSSLHGDIDLTLPADAKVSLKMKSHDGGVYSDFNISPMASATASATAQTAPPPGNGKEAAKYRVQFDSTMRGMINGGGPEVQLTTFRGNIFVRKAK